MTEKEKLASTEEDEWQTGRLKQHVIATLLRVRQEAPTLFRRGEYLPLGASGKRADNVIAFARADMDDAFIVIAPRLVFSALHTGLAPSRSERWAETEIILPERLGHRRYRDVCTGKVVDPKDRIAVNWAFGDHPFVLLLAE